MSREIFYTNFGTMAWIYEPTVNVNKNYAYNAQYGLLFEISLSTLGLLDIVVVAKVYSPLIQHIPLDVNDKYQVQYNKHQVPMITSKGDFLLLNGGEYVINIVASEITENECACGYTLSQLRPDVISIIAPDGSIATNCTISPDIIKIGAYSAPIGEIAKIAVNGDFLQINFADPARAMLFNWKTGAATQLVSLGGDIIFAGDYYIFQDEDFDEHLKNISLIHIPEYCYIMEIEY